MSTSTSRSRPVASIEPEAFAAAGGTPVLWSLTDAEAARAGAVDAGTGVSFLQAGHLQAAAEREARGAVHTDFVGITARFEERLDTAAMAFALTAFGRRHSEVRAFYPLTDGIGVRRVIAPPDYYLEPGHPRGADAVLPPTALAAWVGRCASALARADAVPGFLFAAAADGVGFTFCFAADHVHCDGYSLVLAIGEIVELYRAVVAGRPPRLPDAGDFGDYLVAERQAAAKLRPTHPGVEVWRDALCDNGRKAPTSPLDLGLENGEPQPAVLTSAVVCSAALADRGARRIRRAGAGYTAGLHAILALAAFDTTGSRDYFVATVLAARTPEHAHTQGWLCNFVPVWQRVDDATHVLAHARSIGATLARARAARMDPVHGVLAILGGEGVFGGLVGAPQLVSYMDFRRLRASGDPVLVSARLFSGIGRTRNSNIWFNRYEDRVTASLLIPDNPVAHESAERFLAAIGTRMAELGGGMTR